MKTFSLLRLPALWVMWGLLCGHLVAFKAPKSWPNKFLINVWGGFSVIFIASYTANIAALIAGLFFHNAANTYDTSVSYGFHIKRDFSQTQLKFIADDTTCWYPTFISCWVLYSEKRQTPVGKNEKIHVWKHRRRDSRIKVINSISITESI